MFKISPMEYQDLADASHLVTDLRSSMNGRIVCTPAEMREVLALALDAPDYHGFLARNEESKAVGYIGLNRRFAIYAGGAFYQITELFTAPDARRTGVAQGLIHTAENLARDAGLSSIELGAPRRETHPGTHAFYEAMGYAVVGPRLSKSI